MEWKREFAGYEEKTADQMVEGYVEAGGVAFKQREEGMEMGSGPHFQGYTVFSLSPLQILEQSKKVSRAGLPEEPRHGSTDIHVLTEIKSQRESALAQLKVLAYAADNFDKADVYFLLPFAENLAKSLYLISNLERMEKLASYNCERRVGLYGGRDK